MNKFHKLSGLFSLLIIAVLLSINFFLNDIKDDFTIVQKQLKGTECVEVLQSAAIEAESYYSLLQFQDSKYFPKVKSALKDTKERLQRTLLKLQNLQTTHPEYKIEKFSKMIKSLDSVLSKREKLNAADFDLIDVTLKYFKEESFMLGDRATLNYEGEKELYLLAAIMTHYIPEFRSGVAKLRAMILGGLLKKRFSVKRRNEIVHSINLVELNQHELHRIIGLIGNNHDNGTMHALLTKLEPQIVKIAKISDAITNGGLVRVDPFIFYQSTQEMRKYATDLYAENIRSLYLHLNKRSQMLRLKIFYTNSVLLSIILISILGLAFTYYSTKRTVTKENDITSLLYQSQNALDNFTLVSKINLKGITTYVNERFCNTTGYTSEELVGQAQGMVTHPDVSAESVNEMWETIEHGQIWTGIIKGKKKHGETFYVDILVTPIFDHNNNIIEYLAIRKDITEIETIKERLEKELDISNMNFAEAYNISQEYQHAIEKSNIVVRTDLWGHITYVNDQFCEVSGYSRSELIGKTHKLLRHEDNSDDAYKDLWTTIGVGKIWHGRLKNRSKDGNTYFVNSSIVPIMDVQGNIIEYFGIAYDVTELAEKNERLKESQHLMEEQKELLESQKELYELVFKNTASGVLLIDIETNQFIDCNEPARELLKYDSKNDILHLHPSDISPEFQPDGERSDEKSNKMKRLAINNHTHTFEWKYTRKSGEEFWVEVILTPIELEDRAVLYVVWKDINEKKLAAKELKLKEALLIQQSKFASMGEMIGNIAHQWRQPLNALGLTVQKIELLYGRDQLDSENLHNSVEKSMNLIENMSTTIDDFRDFFRPNKDKEIFLVAEALKKAHSMVEASFTNYQIEYTLEMKDSEISIDGYPNEFSQVLVNLLKNAQDALIETEKESLKIGVKVSKDDAGVCLEICDNGGGVPASALVQVFDPYFSTKEEGKGTGIGLYMSKMIIEDHMGGKLSVVNRDDGACFTIRL